MDSYCLHIYYMVLISDINRHISDTYGFILYPYIYYSDMVTVNEGVNRIINENQLFPFGIRRVLVLANNSDRNHIIIDRGL